MSTCNGNCTRPKVGFCARGLFRDGVMVGDGRIRIPLMLTDSALRFLPEERKSFAMMTDAEIRDMRASVRGMPLWKAQKLPVERAG